MNRRTTTQEDQEVKATSVRPKRTPVGLRPRLAVFGKDPNFEYRIVNDTPGNVSLMKQNGWQLCTNDEIDVGNFRTEQATEVGSLASMVVDSGTGMKAYVMKISKDEYQEIQDAYDREARAMEETLRPNTNDGEYGKISIDRSGRR
jgi:hypothetical protein